MGIAKFAVGVVLCLVLLSAVAVASGFENAAVGTSARAMGGAFRSIADDWTAAYYNPAGLAFQKDNSFGAYVSFTQNRNELNPDYVFRDQANSNSYETGILNGTSINNFHEIYFTPGSGAVTRVPFGKGEVVLGFSAYQPFDANISWKLYQPENTLYAYNDSASGLYPLTQFKNNLDVVAFQVTAAKTSADQKFGVGLGLQLLRADLNYNDLIFRDNPIAELNFRPYEHVPEFVSVDGHGWGFGLRAGLMYRQGKSSLGLTAAIPFSITVKGTGDLNFLMPRNSTLARSEDYKPGTPEYLFTSGASVKMTADYSTKIKLPTSVGLAASYQMTEKFLVAVDAELQMWSKFDGFLFEYSNITGLPIGGTGAEVASFLSASTSRPSKWKSAAKVALGMKYDWIPKLSLLAGASFDQSPDRDHTSINPQLFDSGNKLGLNFGGTLHASPRFNCSLVLAYVHYPNLDLGGVSDLNGADQNGDGIIDFFPGSYKATSIETQMSFEYRF